jgi:hypothetical protein
MRVRKEHIFQRRKVRHLSALPGFFARDLRRDGRLWRTLMQNSRAWPNLKRYREMGIGPKSRVIWQQKTVPGWLD